MRKSKNIYSKFLISLTKNGSKIKAKHILDFSFIKASRKIEFSEKLSNEISNVLLNKRSKVLLKQKQVNQDVLFNRSNIHFRW